MKNLSAALLGHLALPTTQLAEAWRVTRQFDQAVFGWTTFDLNVTIEDVLYRASEGLRPTSAHTTNTLSVDSLDVTAFLDVSTETELTAGLWDDSAIYHFEFVWSMPPATLSETGFLNVVPKRAGTLGRITRQDLIFTAEIRGLADQLQTRIGRQYSPVCPWRHAIWSNEDETFVPSIECQADLDGLGFIVDGTITAVGDDATLTFSDSGNAEDDGFFADGYIHMLTGANAGLTEKVRLWEDKLFTLYKPFPYPVEVGSTYRSVHGDDNLKATCKDVFMNYVNNGAFNDVPGADSIYSTVSGL